VESGEECDGTALNGASCITLGYEGGPLACMSDCRFTTTNCSGSFTYGGTRIAGGGQSGRLEVRISGQWGTVCDDSFADVDARVACRELGFSDGVYVASSVTPDGVGTVWLDDLACVGTETSLSQCPSSGWGRSNCSHSEDVGVRCCNGTCPAVCGDGRVVSGEQCDGADLAGASCATLGFTGGPLSCSSNCTFNTLACITANTWGGARIAGGGSSGRLEVQINGAWGTVCDDSFADVDARVACREFGFTDGAYVNSSVTLDGTGTIWLDELACVGTESSLSMCPSAGWGQANCSHSEDVGVRCCNGTCPAVCGDGRVMALEQCDGTDLAGATCVSRGFQGGTLSCASNCSYNTSACVASFTWGGTRIAGGGTSGRLEVQVNGQWGTVCDDSFGDVEARVACRQLGYSDGAYRPSNVTPDGTGTVWLDDLACTGSEANLSQCPSSGFGVSNCSHSEDVGIRCCDGACPVQCGDGLIGPGEQCDGTNFAGSTCLSLGFSGGTLLCSATCRLDTSSCTR
jgi:hypothetical protein